MESKPKNFKEALDQLENQTEQIIDCIKPHVEEAKAKVTSEVEKNPWAALGIVAVVSFLLGLLLAPRSRRDD